MRLKLALQPQLSELQRAFDGKESETGSKVMDSGSAPNNKSGDF